MGAHLFVLSRRECGRLVEGSDREPLADFARMNPQFVRQNGGSGLRRTQSKIYPPFLFASLSPFPKSRSIRWYDAVQFWSASKTTREISHELRKYKAINQTEKVHINVLQHISGTKSCYIIRHHIYHSICRRCCCFATPRSPTLSVHEITANIYLSHYIFLYLEYLLPILRNFHSAVASVWGASFAM